MLSGGGGRCRVTVVVMEGGAVTWCWSDGGEERGAE